MSLYVILGPYIVFGVYYNMIGKEFSDLQENLLNIMLLGMLALILVFIFINNILSFFFNKPIELSIWNICTILGYLIIQFAIIWYEKRLITMGA